MIHRLARSMRNVLPYINTSYSKAVRFVSPLTDLFTRADIRGYIQNTLLNVSDKDREKIIDYLMPLQLRYQLPSSSEYEETMEYLLSKVLSRFYLAFQDTHTQAVYIRATGSPICEKVSRIETFSRQGYFETTTLHLPAGAQHSYYYALPGGQIGENSALVLQLGFVELGSFSHVVKMKINHGDILKAYLGAPYPEQRGIAGSLQFFLPKETAVKSSNIIPSFYHAAGKPPLLTTHEVKEKLDLT